jgi:hypothetical protein
MPTYSRPGVYLTEGPFSTAAAVGTEVTPTAFLGTASRGPIVPTRIDSWGQYKTLYGDLTNSSDLGYAVYHFFSNGGRTAFVNRVAHRQPQVEPLLSKQNLGQLQEPLLVVLIRHCSEYKQKMLVLGQTMQPLQEPPLKLVLK